MVIIVVLRIDGNTVVGRELQIFDLEISTTLHSEFWTSIFLFLCSLTVFKNADL
jgi:hypothetical protein